MKLNIHASVLSAVLLLSSGMTIFSTNADEICYENIIDEVLQIQQYIDDGLYLETIHMCDDVIEKRNISAEDVALLNSYKRTSSELYNEYLIRSSRREPDFKTILANNGLSNYIYFMPDDYDMDGSTEAFVITGKQDFDSYYYDVNIFFIDSNGHLKKIVSDAYGYRGDTLSTDTNKYIQWVYDALGSGSTACLFGCKNGDVYEPVISRKFNIVYMDPSGNFYGNENHFNDNGHQYVDIKLNFNYSTREFDRYYYGMMLSGPATYIDKVYYEYYAFLSSQLPCKYSLYDIDKNGTPELLIKYEYDWYMLDTVYIYKYDYATNAVSEVGEISGNYLLCTYPDQNGIVGQYCKQGGETIDLYTMDNNGLHLQQLLSKRCPGDYDEIGDLISGAQYLELYDSNKESYVMKNYFDEVKKYISAS